MTLADTSIWVDHLRLGDPILALELTRSSVLMHPFVVGELALGSLPNRVSLVRDLDSLPQARVARTDEVRIMIETRSLYSRGIGFVDAHLLASVALTPNALLWTRDQRLRAVAKQLGLHIHFD
jgi:predicted nucleic acid-binding protein